jgi:hypothetical protein
MLLVLTASVTKKKRYNVTKRKSPYGKIYSLSKYPKESQGDPRYYLFVSLFKKESQSNQVTETVVFTQN